MQPHSPAQCTAAQTRGWQEVAPRQQGEGRAPASFCWHGCQNIFTGQVILTPVSLGTLSSIKLKNTTNPKHPQSSVEGWILRAECQAGGVSHNFHWLSWLQQAKILQCPSGEAHKLLLTRSSQTGLEHDCMNEHSVAVTGHQVGSQRMGGKAIAAGGCGSQHSLLRHLWASQFLKKLRNYMRDLHGYYTNT